MSLLYVLGIFVLGIVSGIQIALYLYDYYDDGIAELTSLLIGIGMVGLSLGFILYSFLHPSGTPSEPDQNNE